MTAQELLAWGTGVTFLLLLFGTAIFILARKDNAPVSGEAMLILRIILALAGAGFAAVLPGFLAVEGTASHLALRAGGALAAFLVLYFFNPPERVRRKAGPEKPQKRAVKNSSIEPSLSGETTKK